MFVGAYMATVSPVMTVMPVMGFAAALATELGMHAACDMMFTASAFVSFIQHILVAELVAVSGATVRQLVLPMGAIMLFMVLDAFVVDFATMLFVMFLMACCHLSYSLS